MDILRDVRRDVAAFVGASGACPDDQLVLDKINDARRVLYPLGAWKDTVDALCVLPYCGVITLPPEYEFAKSGFNACQKITVENDWFTKVGEFESYCGAERSIIQKPGQFFTFRDRPKSKAPVNCPDNGYRLAVVFEDQEDAGTVIKFHARGREHKKVLLTRTARKAWELNTGSPSDDLWIHDITYVIKPVTKGRVRVFAFDGANPNYLLAIYEPDQVNPSMVRYGVGLGPTCGIVLKAKKKFAKLYNDDQPVDIHTEALIHTLQAIAAREAKDMAGFGIGIANATDYLNKELAGPQSTSVGHMRWSGSMRVTGLVN